MLVAAVVAVLRGLLLELAVLVAGEMGRLQRPRLETEPLIPAEAGEAAGLMLQMAAPAVPAAPAS